MPDPSGPAMAFDFGLRNLGVAIATPITRTARGLTTLTCRAGKPKWHALEALVVEHGPAQLVVGLPLNMDGTRSDMAERATQFAERLAARTGLPVALQDERLTTRTAKGMLEDARRLGRAATDHELAACLIAEDWLNR